MPPRLAVVISQTPTRDHRAADIEESLVAELMMAGGLDANIVGPLQRIAPDSTDLLCLAGFTQDIALLSWLSIADAQAAWEELQLNGSFVDLSPEVSATGVANSFALKGRRILYLQLKHDSQPAEVCKLLKLRLHNMQVKTVSILPLQSTARKTAPQTDLAALPSFAPNVMNDSFSGARAESTPQPQLPVSKPNPSQQVSTPLHTVQQNAEELEMENEQWQDLDKLVDDLDALDL